MGDSETALPPSKKRAAGRELSRDNPGLDDDEVEVFDHESDCEGVESQDNTNNETAKKEDETNDVAKTVCEVVESQDNTKNETEKKENETHDLAKTTNSVHETVITSSEVVESQDNAKNETKKKEDETDDVAKTDEKKDSVSSFQHLSSSQNAFTGLIGTGFSSSTFSFGSITKTDQQTFPSLGFSTNGNLLSDKAEGSKMQKVDMETGEENEDTVFTADSLLFEFLDGVWKERGKGGLKVNVSTSESGKKARLVMRARGNYRLILNASLFPDMKLTNMEKKGITFACLNTASEGKENSLSTIALKFKDSSVVEDFRDVVTQHKGRNMDNNTETNEVS